MEVSFVWDVCILRSPFKSSCFVGCFCHAKLGILIVLENCVLTVSSVWISAGAHQRRASDEQKNLNWKPTYQGERTWARALKRWKRNLLARPKFEIRPPSRPRGGGKSAERWWQRSRRASPAGGSRSVGPCQASPQFLLCQFNKCTT